MATEIEKEFEKAVLTLDIERVQELLKQGVSPNTGIQGEHPFYYIVDAKSADLEDYLYMCEFTQAEADKIPLGAEFDRRQYGMVKTLLEAGIKLYDYDKTIEGSNFVAEQVMLSDNHMAVNEIVMHTIKQTLADGLKPYEFLNNDFYVKLYDGFVRSPNSFSKDMLQKRMDAYKRVHKDISIGMEYTKTPIEKALKEMYFYSSSDFWEVEFNAPPAEAIFSEMMHRYADPNQKSLVPTLRSFEKSKLKKGIDVSLQKMKKDKEGIYMLPNETPEEVLEDLDALIGLTKEKDQFMEWASEIMMKAEGDPDELIGYSSAYLGNPGTAKTTLFRMKARFLHSMGLVGPKYKEVTAGDLEGAYVGHTAIKTKKVLESCDVLFIDEAYALAKDYGSQSSFGQEAVDEIVAYTENNRGKPIFFAGYPGDMQRLFKMNAGLQSRVSTINTIDDYNVETLGKIFDIGLEDRGYAGIAPEAREILLVDLMYHKEKMGEREFANAREIRTVLDDLNGVVKSRLYGLGENSHHNEDDERPSLVRQFQKLQRMKPIARSKIVIEARDIEALKIREKHLALKGKDVGIVIEGFRMREKPEKSVKSDTTALVVASKPEVVRAYDFNQASSSVKEFVVPVEPVKASSPIRVDFANGRKIEEKREEPYIPYKSTRIGFGADIYK